MYFKHEKKMKPFSKKKALGLSKKTKWFINDGAYMMFVNVIHTFLFSMFVPITMSVVVKL